MTDVVIVNYFTKNTLYEKEAERLQACCEKLGLEYQIEGIEPFGKWHEHTCYKPIFLLQKMQELKKPLLWVDADAEIVKTPDLQLNCDLAARLFDAYPASHPSHLFTGTLYLNDTEAALEIVQQWAEECQHAIRNRANSVDQSFLAEILHSSKARFQSLPVGYALLFDEEIPSHEERFIIHYQASRTYRKIINGEFSLSFFDKLSVDELRQLRPRLNSP